MGQLGCTPEALDERHDSKYLPFADVDLHSDALASEQAAGYRVNGALKVFSTDDDGGTGGKGRSLLGINSWYYYCSSSETSSCPPCDLYPDYPCENDDEDGGDDRICMLPSYWGGNVFDDDICGYWQTPRNQGRQDVMANINGAWQCIGDMLSFMDLSGMWRGTFRLKCPYMMRIDSTNQLVVKLDVKNSDGRAWTSWVNMTNYGLPRRTCTSVAIQMESASHPCKPNNITLTVSAYVESTLAQDPTTCVATSDPTLVTDRLWYIPINYPSPPPPPDAPAGPPASPRPPTPWEPDFP